MIRDTSPGSLLLDVFVYGALLLVVIVTLYPVLHVASMAISAGDAVIKRTVTFYPKGFSLRAFELIFSSRNIPIGYRNQVMYAALGTTISLILTTAMAYPLSKRRLTLRSFYMVLVVVTMFFGGGLIPLYLLVQRLGMLNTIWAVVLPAAVSAYNVIILRTFFQAVPQEMEESAFLDGANDIRILISIVMPVSKAALATIGLFYLVSHWNSWFYAVIFLRDHDLKPLQVVLRNIILEQGMIAEELDINESDMQAMRLVASRDNYINYEKLKHATLIAAMLPMLIVYPFIQKYFAKGVMIGSLKA